MISQKIKDVYFSFNKWLNKPYFYFLRFKYRINRKENLYLHLGSGDNYREGFINIEGNIARKKDMWLDFNNGLPFSNNSVSFVFCCHTLEHFYPEEAIEIIKEINRVLKPGGIARIAVPSFEHALEIIQGKHSSKWPQNFENSVGQAINYLFCDGQHKYAYNFYVFQQFAIRAGFKSENIIHYSASYGIAPKLYGTKLVGEEDVPDSLVVELIK